MSDGQSAVERLAEAWNATPDYAPTEYDRGRVEQRHDMTTQLLEAIEADRAAVLAEQRTYEPCDAEIWSWEIFQPEQVDPYWMRCHLLGPHDEHENSETGATWPRLPVEENGENDEG